MWYNVFAYKLALSPSSMIWERGADGMKEEHLKLLKEFTLMSDFFASIAFDKVDVGLELLKPLHLIDDNTIICEYQTQKQIKHVGRRS